MGWGPETQEPPFSLCPQDILNHVFEDVETFVSRLQKSAEATRVLEHRERGRRTRRRTAGGKDRPKRPKATIPPPHHSQRFLLLDPQHLHNPSAGRGWLLTAELPGCP